MLPDEVAFARSLLNSARIAEAEDTIFKPKLELVDAFKLFRVLTAVYNRQVAKDNAAYLGETSDKFTLDVAILLEDILIDHPLIARTSVENLDSSVFLNELIKQKTNDMP